MMHIVHITLAVIHLYASCTLHWPTLPLFIIIQGTKMQLVGSQKCYHTHLESGSLGQWVLMHRHIP
jgi:hypothetical protein